MSHCTKRVKRIFQHLEQKQEMEVDHYKCRTIYPFQSMQLNKHTRSHTHALPLSLSFSFSHPWSNSNTTSAVFLQCVVERKRTKEISAASKSTSSGLVDSSNSFFDFLEDFLDPSPCNGPMSR
eukprot:m.61946 g.61946  ORF g.61946 m.61946 type:complete len:123 (+) comp11888_c0_seq2:28-396(+)